MCVLYIYICIYIGCPRPPRWPAAAPRATAPLLTINAREFIHFKTSMITGEDPLRGLLFYLDPGFAHTLH